MEGWHLLPPFLSKGWIVYESSKHNFVPVFKYVDKTKVFFLFPTVLHQSHWQGSK
jgi:hypothetical protein